MTATKAAGSICALALTVLVLPVVAADAADSQERGRAALLRMATYVASLERFTVTVRGGYDVDQDDGRKVQFLETRAVTLERPNRLRAEETHSDGRNNVVLFDGSRITVFDSDAGVFAEAAQPGSVDDAIIYFVRDLKMRLPLAPLFSTRFLAELGERLKFVD